MEITGEYHIQAPRLKVWDALNDPEVLRRCIPGCEQFEQQAKNEYHAKVVSKIGPVKAKFNAKVSLTELQPPQSYTLLGEGQGGVAGFGQGSARVNLAEVQDGTQLIYSAEFKVGGKLAQVGSRLVAGATRKIADDFFANFVAIMNPEATDDSEPEQPGDETRCP